MHRVFFASVYALLHLSLHYFKVAALENGLASTPPMGWLSWERFGCQTDCSTFPDDCISENLYAAMTDKLVELGLSDLGYQYVNVDDCWSKRDREKSGELLEDPERFLRGMAWLSEYIHSRGLKFGLYTDIGTKTCGGYPGLNMGSGNYTVANADINKFVSWAIDSLKVDGCYAEVRDMPRMYPELGSILNGTNRSILYSCSWPAYQEDHCENPKDMLTLVGACNLWRNFDDVEDSWDSVGRIVKYFARTKNDLLPLSAGPGHWNDPDMLLVGNPGLSISEQKAQFYIWCMLAAPLYISADLRKISSDSLSILKNAEAIAVNQDKLGKQGYIVLEAGTRRVWVKPLSTIEGAERAAVLFENRASIFGPIGFKFNVKDLGWGNDSADYDAACQYTYSVRDVDAHVEVSSNVPLATDFVTQVDESSVRFFVFTKNIVISDVFDIQVE